MEVRPKDWRTWHGGKVLNSDRGVMVSVAVGVEVAAADRIIYLAGWMVAPIIQIIAHFE